MEARVVIVGGGTTGRELAERLRTRHLVLLLEQDRDRVAGLDGYRTSELDVINLTGQPGLVAVFGDGTSRMVLQTLFASDAQCALVAATGEDASNVEVARIAREVGFNPVIAVQHDVAFAERYLESRVTALDRTQLLVGELERSLRHHGAIIPRGVGLGRGELMEIRLVRTSPILGRPLKELAPFRWRIAAIFRGDELIVPLGDTTLEVDDRVLLVGDPAILSTVVEYLRLGKPHFPQPYGPRFLTLELGEGDAKLLEEAQRLCGRTTASGLVRGLLRNPKAGAGRAASAGAPSEASDPEPRGTPAPSSPAGEGGAGAPLGQTDEDLLTLLGTPREEELSTVALPPLGAPGFSAAVKAQRAGLVVIRPRQRPFLSRVLGTRWEDSRLCDTVASPVLFARQSQPYRRILLPVSGSDINLRSAELAIDLTRQLKASLTAMNVDLPRYVSGLEDEIVHEEVVPIRRLCQLYDVPLDYRHRWGNPVRHLLDEAVHHDLIVVARRHGRADTYFAPDLALRLARAAPCSVLVLTLEGEPDAPAGR